MKTKNDLFLIDYVQTQLPFRVLLEGLADCDRLMFTRFLFFDFSFMFDDE